jgi:formylglycine-generating enzyme required for sulfatase activity
VARVFLSHAGPDKPVVRRIATELRAAGHETWLDEDDLLVGESIPAAVERGLGDADFVVLCLSKVAAERGWVEAERDATMMQQFRERKERILPVRLDEVTPPGLVRPLAHVDLFPDEQAFHRGIARLTSSIAAYTARRAMKGEATAPNAQTTTDTLATTGAAPPGRPMARNGAQPTPVYLNAEVQALSEQLERARQRKQSLRDAGIGTDDVDREILELRRKLRGGGQLRAGDALGDGRYLLVKQVGRGGFSVVWEAFDRAEQRRVAIKVLHQHLASDPQRRERFFRGARMMLDLKHPAVVRVLDPREEDESFCYFVMELVPGGNLREAVLAQRVKRDSVLPLILQVGKALAEAHRKQLVHRDIKPANILLDEQGNAKLTDFDLVGAHDTTGGTRTGALGTVVYAAPECLDRPQDATARADVFGLGMTTIFCLAGHDLSMDTLVDRAGALAQLDCPESVRKVLERAVEWKQERRFADAAEMVDALRGALDGSSQSAAADNDNSARTQPVVQTRSVPVAVSLLAAQRQTNDDEAVLRIQQRPRWAVASGKDHYGEWAEFSVKDARHRMRWIPPGTFLMGSPKAERGRFNEGPQHEVTITRGYWLGEMPVTQALWVAVMGENPSHFCDERPDALERPVEQVSWDDCQRFLDVLNAQVAGLAARLPTEAEWERACRAGTTTAIWVGELSGEMEASELDAIAWYGSNSGDGTHPVGRKAPNPYGLHDMLGNVWEWCADGMRGYAVASVTDPVGDERGSDRVYRGGSWNYIAWFMRAAIRYADSRDYRGGHLGFRLAGGRAALR